MGSSNSDAATFGQLKKAYSGIAMAFAQAAVAPSLAPGEQSISGGAGYFQNTWGLNFKYEARPSDKWFIGCGRLGRR